MAPVVATYEPRDLSRIVRYQVIAQQRCLLPFGAAQCRLK